METNRKCTKHRRRSETVYDACLSFDVFLVFYSFYTHVYDAKRALEKDREREIYQIAYHFMLLQTILASSSEMKIYTFIRIKKHTTYAHRHTPCIKHA